MSSPLAKGAVAAQTKPTTTTTTSTTTGASSPSPSPSSSKPSLRPVQTRPTPLAQAARHALPALQAVLFAARFRALVDDPVSAMAGALPVTAALQVAYALVCLPVAGSGGGGGGVGGGAGGNAGGKAGRKPMPAATAGGMGVANKPPRIGGEGGGRRKGGSGGGGGPVATAILSLVLSLLVTPFLYISMVLFGAPFLTHGAHTLLCAAHVAVLALFPLFYVHGVDGSAWAALGGFAAPLDETFGGLVGAVVGAWLGAVPIPLDWDRDWQRWPVTIMCGLYAGHVLGRVVGGTLAWGKRF